MRPIVGNTAGLIPVDFWVRRSPAQDQRRRLPGQQTGTPGCIRECLSGCGRRCRRPASHRSGGLARAGGAGLLLREPVGPPEGLPHRGLLVVDALERAGGAADWGHRDHHILVVLWLPEPSGVDIIETRAKAPGSTWDGCRILTALPSPVAAKTWLRWLRDHQAGARG